LHLLHHTLHLAKESAHVGHAAAGASGACGFAVTIVTAKLLIKFHYVRKMVHEFFCIISLIKY